MKKLTKNSKEIMDLIKENLSLDKNGYIIKTGHIYTLLKMRICYRDNNIDIPVSHVAWFLKYGKWPKENVHIDHKDNNTFNNHPDNLQELTPSENSAKTRGRTRKRYGKYGYSGISVSENNKGRFYAYVYNKISIGKYKKEYLFSADTLEELEIMISEYIEKPSSLLSDILDK